MSAPVRSQSSSDEIEVGSAVLRTSAVVTADSSGRSVATLHLHGELCPSTAEALEREIERLIEDGVVELTVDLRGLRFCTSHGLDIWQGADERLRHVGGGVDLVGASGVVRHVLDVVADADPDFSPSVHQTVPRTSGQVTAPSEPGRSGGSCDQDEEPGG